MELPENVKKYIDQKRKEEQELYESIIATLKGKNMDYDNPDRIKSVFFPDEDSQSTPEQLSLKRQESHN